MAAGSGGREIYFEFTAVGNVVRVSAICSVTGLEVHVVGPANASRSDLEALALRKLEARLAAERPGALPGRGGPDGGRGRLV